jgi:hypothetical protein
MNGNGVAANMVIGETFYGFDFVGFRMIGGAATSGGGKKPSIIGGGGSDDGDAASAELELLILSERSLLVRAARTWTHGKTTHTHASMPNINNSQQER